MSVHSAPVDPGHGPLVMGLTWTWSSLALIVVGARFWVRLAVTKALSVEDWLMLAAVILNTAGASCLTVAFRHGFGKHDADLTFDQLVIISKWSWMSFTPGIVCSILARISIAILLVRIFGSKVWLKSFLIVITLLQVVASIMLAITSWVQVRPAKALWNPMIPAERLSPNVVPRMGNVVGALFATGDLCYVLFPVLVVWKLNMPLHRKVGLCVLLAMSLFTMGVSIAKAVAAKSITDKAHDAQYHSSLALMWSLTEQAFVIMMGCAPPLRSIAKLQLPLVSSISTLFGRLINSRGTAYEPQDSNELGQSNERTHVAEKRLKRIYPNPGPRESHVGHQLDRGE